MHNKAIAQQKHVIPKKMKQLLFIYFLIFSLVGCSPSDKFIVSDEIDEIKTLINPDCFYNKTKCYFSIITDKHELLNIVRFLNARNEKWSYASTTYPSSDLSSRAKLNNKEMFEIYIGVRGAKWIGLSINGEQVLQSISEEEYAVFKKMLNII